MEAQDGKARVRVGGVSGCPACDAGEGCGAGLFGRLLNNRSVEVIVSNEIDASSGQAVDVGIPETQLLALVFRLFGLPLVAGILGASVAMTLLESLIPSGGLVDLIVLASGLASAGLALVWNRRTAREFGRRLDVNLTQVYENSDGFYCAGYGMEGKPR